jgi:RNA polymerase sigma-70 factor (ECF subfamily)
MEEKDEFLIMEYLDGNQNSFKLLIDKYTPSIYNYAVRFVGENESFDVTQDIFLKVWKNIKKFDKNKSSFKTWIFTITRNTITDYLRKRKTILFSSLDTEEEIFADTLEDQALMQDEELSKIEDVNFLNSLLEKIPNNYKEILILHYQGDMTFDEIGKLLGKPLNTVKSYHRRALSLLREMMK